MKTAMTYIGTLDSKNRLTIRKSHFKYYKVYALASGVVVLEPQKIDPVTSLSPELLKQIDTSVANYRKGNVSDPIDVDAVAKKT
jgi:hypothetical protein